MEEDYDSEKDYKCSAEARKAIELAKEYDRVYDPRSGRPRRGVASRRTSRKTNQKKKGMTMTHKNQKKVEVPQRKISDMFKKGGVKTNFQGVAWAACSKMKGIRPRVFINMNYKKHWTFVQKHPTHIPSEDDEKCCKECYLLPCAVRVLRRDLAVDHPWEEGMAAKDILFMEKEQLLDHMLCHFRDKMEILQGKSFVMRQWPDNDSVPECVRRAAEKIAESMDGYDTDLDNDKCGFRKKTKTEENEEESEEEYDEEKEWAPISDHDGMLKTQAF